MEKNFPHLLSNTHIFLMRERARKDLPTFTSHWYTCCSLTVDLGSSSTFGAPAVSWSVSNWLLVLHGACLSAPTFVYCFMVSLSSLLLFKLISIENENIHMFLVTVADATSVIWLNDQINISLNDRLFLLINQIMIARKFLKSSFLVIFHWKISQYFLDFGISFQ